MLAYISGLSSLIPFIAGIISYRFGKEDMRLFTLFFGIAVVSDLYLWYTAMHNVNNLWALHIWSLVEYCFLAYVFSYWQKSSTFRKLLRWSIPVFMILWLVAKLVSIEVMSQFHNYTRSIGSMILTITSVVTLYRLNESEGIFRQYQFWISLGVLIYFAGNIIWFSINNIVLVGSLFFMHSIVNIIANLLYAGGFLCLLFQWKRGGFYS